MPKHTAVASSLGGETHAALPDVTADQHHARDHALAGATHSGQLAHSALSGIGTADHHSNANDHSPTPAHHDALTIGADADVLLGLSGQQLVFDVQNPNLVLASPDGQIGDPTLRALVDADIPAGIARDSEVNTQILSHVLAADPHSVYQKESEKSQANGYASLDGTTKVPAGELGSGAPDGTKFLRDDRQWATPTAAVNVKETEVDFGPTFVAFRKFSGIADAEVSAASRIIAALSGKAPTDKAQDETELDSFDFRVNPSAGTFDLFMQCLTGRVKGRFRVNYVVG